MKHRLYPFVAVVALIASTAAAGAQILHPSDPEDRREIREDRFGPGATAPYVARNGMVSTASHHATMAGLETLRRGGNAFDAMAVVQFCLAVAEPYASGIGGGLFMVIYDAESGEVITIDGREEAPHAFHPDAFRDDQDKIIPYRERTTGGNAVGVPGTLAATAHLLESRGSMSLAETLQPAIRLARQGFTVPEPFARSLQSNLDRLEKYPAALQLFSRPDGTPLQAGDFFSNPDLAATFERIAREGIELFYEGEIAEEIANTVQHDPHRPGVMTTRDIANYRAVLREPVSVNYRGYEVFGMNMPSSGGPTLGLMLNLLEGSGFTDTTHAGANSIHLLANVQNVAFADRNRYMGDADFADVPVEGLLAKSYAGRRRVLLETDRALSTPVEPGKPEGAAATELDPVEAEEGRSTTHFSIVDRHRNVVSVTSTIEQHFGSAMIVSGRGFLLNNELADFDAEAYDDGRLVPNAPEGGWKPRRTALGDAAKTEGGKRPRSSMSPTLVLRDGAPKLALGSPGGSRIIGITLNVLLNVIDRNMDVQSAINAPRVIARNGPLELEAPLYLDDALRADLEKRGFDVRNAEAVGAVQAIQIDDENWLHGAADPRREGLAVGY